jgi:hypothetical protein
VSGPETVDDWSGAGFVPRTLRTAAVVGGIVVLVLASYAQWWAIGPMLTGLGLSAALLYAWDRFVRVTLTPERAREDGSKGNRRRWPIVVFSLIKYPLVGLLLFAAVRVWGSDPHRALAFLGGFILLHLVIGLRATSRAMMGQSS